MTFPIAVFAYNRPKHLELCLEAIERSFIFLGHRLPLYIFCDAPRLDEHKENTQKVYEIAQGVSDAKVIVREHNLGFKNITEGISRLCKEYGSAIIIEDDIVISPDFLRFMCKGLEAYANESKVFMISGFMYQNQPSRPETFFLSAAFIWGWATWQRAWEHYSWNPEGWETFLKNRKNRQYFDFFGTYRYSKMLRKTMEGKLNTWDIQWMYILHQKKGLALYPARSLVWNSGIGGGTHGVQGQKEDPYQCKREEYIHGKEILMDFTQQRLSSSVLEGKAFPIHIRENRKAMQMLALTFHNYFQASKKRHFSYWKKLFYLKVKGLLSFFKVA